jgi:thiosulfate dehydrogenase [quinone] large subunit
MNGSMKTGIRQLRALSILRILIGWHFLYEGAVKLFSPNWTASGYLLSSQGFLSNFFQSLAESEGTLNVIDFLNVWGLILIGLGLFLGLFTRLSCYAGAILLLLYYLSHPPFVGLEYPFGQEGNYLFVDKNLIELVTLLVLSMFGTGRYLGLDILIFRRMKN